MPRFVSARAVTVLRPRVKTLLRPWMSIPVAAHGSAAGLVVEMAPSPGAATSIC